jgi:hypothetical protein
VPWFTTGGAPKGITLSAGTVTSVTLVDGRRIVVECSGVDTGDYLALGYRAAIGGEAAVAIPASLTDPPAFARAFHPFALLERTCWSRTLPGREMPVFLDPQIKEIP